MAAEKKRGRLSRSGDFDRVYREGRSHSNRYFVLYAFPREADEGEPEGEGEEAQEALRLGLSVSRKVGGAVERNAVKRAIREAFWELSEGLPQQFDFVIVARHDAAALVERDGTSGVESALKELFREAGIERGNT
jgi:ribonuclease P protein component